MEERADIALDEAGMGLRQMARNRLEAGLDTMILNVLFTNTE